MLLLLPRYTSTMLSFPNSAFENLTVAYIRVSTTKQDFERQRERIKEYAQHNHFIVTKFFEDKHTGSDYSGRQGFKDLLLYLEVTPKIKILLFDEISRMGRDTAEQVTTYKRLSQMGIKIFTVGKGEFGKNKEDNLLFTVLSAISEYEKQTIIDRTSSGRRQVVLQGATQISRKPYGYNILMTQKDKQQIIRRQFVEINEQEAKVVEKIYTMIDAGNGMTDIIRYLKQNHILSPTGNDAWGRTSITRILHNTMYYGKWAFGKYYKNGKTKYSLTRRDPKDFVYVDVPSIISKELFDRVQIKLFEKKQKFNPKNQKHIYTLKGLLVCDCNRSVQSETDHRNGFRTYRCPRRNIIGVQKKKCPIQAFNCDFIEKVLLQELKKKIIDTTYFRDLKLQKLTEYQSPSLELQEKHDNLLQELKKNEILVKTYYQKAAQFELENIDKAHVYENLADSILKETKRLKEELETLKQEILLLEENAIDMSILKDLEKGLQRITQDELNNFSEENQTKKQQFIRRYIKEVKIEYLEEETLRLRESLQKLRKGMFAKNNLHRRKLYRMCFNKEHQPRKLAVMVVCFTVKFVNHLSLEIKLPYFHENPDLAYSYFTEDKIAFIPEK